MLRVASLQTICQPTAEKHRRLFIHYYMTKRLPINTLMGNPLLLLKALKQGACLSLIVPRPIKHTEESLYLV